MQGIVIYDARSYDFICIKKKTIAQGGTSLKYKNISTGWDKTISQCVFLFGFNLHLIKFLSLVCLWQHLNGKIEFIVNGVTKLVSTQPFRNIQD